MLSMTTCWACDTELRPEWKFCVQCGVPVEHPEGEAPARGKRTQLSPLATFGWIFGCIGVGILLAGIAVVLFVK